MERGRQDDLRNDAKKEVRNSAFLKRFVGHGPLVHPDKCYGPLKKKRCNNCSKLGFIQRSSNRNVCKAYLPFQNVKAKSINP